jgi:hypothetical protein
LTFLAVLGVLLWIALYTRSTVLALISRMASAPTCGAIFFSMSLRFS